jgi:hypothetical protein
LQIASEPALGAVQRLDLGQKLFNGRHETFVSNIAVKFSCQYEGGYSGVDGSFKGNRAVTYSVDFEFFSEGPRRLTREFGAL